MKAIAASFSIPLAAVMAVDAGCDGVLVCHAGQEVQASVLEHLIHAVEEERLPRRRVDDALARGLHAKERFLGAGVGFQPPSAKALRQTIGSDEHQAIAEEMARFA